MVATAGLRGDSSWSFGLPETTQRDPHSTKDPVALDEGTRSCRRRRGSDLAPIARAHNRSRTGTLR